MGARFLYLAFQEEQFAPLPLVSYSTVCNASLHQPSKTTEIATSWESFITVLTKICEYASYFVESNVQNMIEE